jgi:hypothetical protein
VGNLAELRSRLTTIREGARIEEDVQGRIGCALIGESRFFPRDQWVAAPRNWKPRTQSGERYDLSTGEGERVWRECLRQGPSPLRRSGPLPSASRPRDLPRAGARCLWSGLWSNGRAFVAGARSGSHQAVRQWGRARRC